jgi:hypothetical protein
MTKLAVPIEPEAIMLGKLVGRPPPSKLSSDNGTNCMESSIRIVEFGSTQKVPAAFNYLLTNQYISPQLMLF